MNMKKILFFSMVMLISQSACALTVVVKNYFYQSDTDPMKVRLIYTGAPGWRDMWGKESASYNTGLSHVQGLQVLYKKNGALVCKSFDINTYITQVLRKNKSLRGLGTIELNIVKNKV